MSSLLKFGIYSGQLDKSRNIVKGKSLNIYGEGLVNLDRIEKEIIPIIEERKIDFPIVICSYFSQYPSSKTGIDTVVTKRGIEFKHRKPKSVTESCDWFIDQKKNIIYIGQKGSS